jgi:hypothetical protein
MATKPTWHYGINLNERGLETARFVAYSGFNWVAILAFLLKTEPDKVKRTNEINDIIAFYVMRGTKTAKALPKMEQEGRARMEAVIVKYSIKENAQGPEDVTMGRIASIFPQVVAGFLLVGVARVIGKVPTSLPKEYCSNQGPSLMENETHKEAWISWFRSAHKVLNKGAKMSEDKAADWFNIFYNSDIIPMAERAKIMGNARTNATKLLKALTTPPAVSVQQAIGSQATGGNQQQNVGKTTTGGKI